MIIFFYFEKSRVPEFVGCYKVGGPLRASG